MRCFEIIENNESTVKKSFCSKMVFYHCHAVNEPLIRCHSGCTVPFSLERKKQTVSSCLTLVDNLEFMFFYYPSILLPSLEAILTFRFSKTRANNKTIPKKETRSPRGAPYRRTCLIALLPVWIMGMRR